MGHLEKYYFDDSNFMREISSFPGAFHMQEGIHHERLIVFRATLTRKL